MRENGWCIRRTMILCTVLLLIITSCDQKKNGPDTNNKKPPHTNTVNEEERVKSTVLLYISLLSDGYRKQNMDGLTDAATENRATKAYYHMAALSEGFVKMDSVLKEIKFVSMKIDPLDKAEAVTEEKWDYKYINFQSGKEVYDNSVDYVLTYHLVKVSGKWFVDDTVIQSSTEKKSEKYEPIIGKDKAEK